MGGVLGVRADERDDLRGLHGPGPGQPALQRAGPLRGQLAWDAVAAPVGAAVAYVVTRPDARQFTTGATSHTLPAVSLVGTYGVQTRIAGTWLSPAVSRVVTNVGGVYVCG